MGRPLRRREAGLLQGGQQLLLPGLVGAGAGHPFLREQGRMGQAAQGIPGGLPGGRPRGQCDDGGRVRSQESDCPGQADAGRGQGPRVLVGNPQGQRPGGGRALRRRGAEESGVQENLCRIRQIPAHAGGLVQPGRETHGRLPADGEIAECYGKPEKMPKIEKGPRFVCGPFAIRRSLTQFSRRLRSIQAFFSWICMRWVSRSAVGSSPTLSTSGKSPRAVLVTASCPATNCLIISSAETLPSLSLITVSLANSR